MVTRFMTSGLLLLVLLLLLHHEVACCYFAPPPPLPPAVPKLVWRRWGVGLARWLACDRGPSVHLGSSRIACFIFSVQPYRLDTHRPRIQVRPVASQSLDDRCKQPCVGSPAVDIALLSRSHAATFPVSWFSSRPFWLAR